MTVGIGSYDTSRLRVVEWRSRGDDVLLQWLSSALTEGVTHELPPSWQGELLPTPLEWVAIRDEEGSFFLVEEKSGGGIVGLFMFFPREVEVNTDEVRIGYVMGEEAWGKGYATEIVQGFVTMWHDTGFTGSLLGMVSPSNQASCRVLEKSGFLVDGKNGDILRYRYQAGS